VAALFHRRAHRITKVFSHQFPLVLSSRQLDGRSFNGNRDCGLTGTGMAKSAGRGDDSGICSKRGCVFYWRDAGVAVVDSVQPGSVDTTYPDDRSRLEGSPAIREANSCHRAGLALVCRGYLAAGSSPAGFAQAGSTASVSAGAVSSFPFPVAVGDET